MVAPCPPLETVVWHDLFLGRPRSRRYPKFNIRRCLRCLLLVMCTYPFVKKALTLHLVRGEGRERYIGCN